MRTPNRRWRASRQVCLERCRITWLNVYRVRRLCELEHGYDPELDGFDQKPFHFNESGSQLRETLHWKGVPEVSLKECASAVRTRWTACTWTSSKVARFEEYPPLEALFKGGDVVQQRLDDMLMTLCAGGDHGELGLFSAQVGPKGSYRTEHVLSFLSTHLEEPGPSRRWCIIMADFYGPHADDAVFDFCWTRMYVLLLIGGGITGILQVPDTHLHCPLSRKYQDLEMQDLVEQQRRNPQGCPSRDREACCRDLIAAWRDQRMHLLAQRGWWDNLLANDLKGAEDHLGRGVAKQLWDEMSMGTLREQALFDVEEEHKAGRLTWDEIKRVIEPFPKRGQLDTYIEGMDDEGDAEEIERGAPAWDDGEELSDSEGEIEKTATLADALPQHIIRRALSDAQQRCAEEGKDRLARLYRIREEAKHLPNPRIRHMIDATIHHVEVQVRGAGQTDKDVAADVRSAFVEESARYRRPPAKRARVAKAVAKPIAKPIALDHIAASARRLLRRPVCLHVPREFTASDLGQGRCAGGTQAHFRCRFELFARIARLYGNLDEEVQANLDRTFKRIDDHRRKAGGELAGKRYGSVFRDDMKELQAKYRAGEKAALAQWIEKWARRAGPGLGICA